jgi:hypothetical protein
LDIGEVGLDRGQRGCGNGAGDIYVWHKNYNV